jgi:hypothetical protein
MIKCPHCEKKFVLKPMKNPDGTLNWKNILYFDPVVVGFTLTFIFLLLAFKGSVANAEYAMEHPKEFCTAAGFQELPQVENKDYNVDISQFNIGNISSSNSSS